MTPRPRHPDGPLTTLAVAVAVVLPSLAGCASGATAGRASPAVFQGTRLGAPWVRTVAAAERELRARHPPTPAGLVVNALHEAGYRFGTDGTLESLALYLRDSHPQVGLADARPGDVVLFDQAPGSRCAGHAAVVESVDADGRVTFIEARDERVRRGHLDPARPLTRRDEGGRILNSFLRVKKPDDAPGTRYFAGDMVCAVVRPR